MSDTKEVQTIDKNSLKMYLDTAAPGLSEKEAFGFLEVAKSYGLNPFKREIYAVPFKDKSGSSHISILTGYEVYLKRAERTGLLDGFEVETKGSLIDREIEKYGRKTTSKFSNPDNPAMAIVTIYRKDRTKAFRWSVDFDEYTQHNSMWDSKPMTMLKKVALSQAFRLCFPDELGGMPYTQDEMPDELTGLKDITPSDHNQKKEDSIPDNNNPVYIELIKDFNDLVRSIDKDVVSSEDKAEVYRFMELDRKGELTIEKIKEFSAYLRKTYKGM